MLHLTFETMGTVASLRLRRSDALPRSLAAVQSCFQRYDDVFSLYKPSSELSQMAAGRVALTASTPEVRAAYADCIDWRNATGGDFTPHRPDGVIDLSGIVKAQAMNHAELLLDEISPEGWLLDVGGDVLGSRPTKAGPRSLAAELWQIGIVDPEHRQELLCSIPLGARWSAVATSGTAERGEHVWRTDSIAEFAQVTVLAEHIDIADVLATAILAGGRRQLDHATRRHEIDALVVTRTGEILTTPYLRNVIAGA